MGIEKFFSSLNQNKIIPPIIFPLTKPLKTRYLFLDFNSIIHVKSKEITTKLNQILLTHILNQQSDELNKFNKEYHSKIIDIYAINDTIFDQLIITGVLNYVKHILTKYINSTDLEYFYIAIDGTPSKAKMIEQRKRRYMNYIIHESHKKIFEQQKSSLDQTRLTYEKQKYQWNTGNITPGTNFMLNLENQLVSNVMQKEINNICPNLKQYIFSGCGVPGEAEKKIVNYIKNLNYVERTVKSDNIVIYSPDSDVIILSMILHCNINNNAVSGLTMLRHNQQKNNYDFINIDLACKYLFNFVVNKCPNLVLLQDSIIMDICFIFTIFGNDFVAKIESYEVNHFFEVIILKYLQVLNTIFDEHGNIQYLITNHHNSKLTINQYCFMLFFKILALQESENLETIYLLNHYINIPKLAKQLNTTKLNFIKITDSCFKKIKLLKNAIINNQNLTSFIDDHEFCELLEKLFIIESTESNIILKFANYYKLHSKFPTLNLKLIKSHKTANSDITKNIIADKLKSMGLRLTKYDIELYKFDNMTDEYQKKLHAYHHDTGHISLDLENHCWIRQQKIVKHESTTLNRDQVINSYLEALMWVFQSYFNSYDDDETKFGDMWYYSLINAPFINEIIEYLNKNSNNPNFINQIYSGLSQYKIERTKYFTPIQQLLYVTPPFENSDLKYIPEPYKHFFRKSIYKNMKKLIDELFANRNTQINCKGALYLTKCHVKNVDFPISDADFIFEVSKIKSNVTPYRNIQIFSNS